jgi:hypothetical protein
LVSALTHPQVSAFPFSELAWRDHFGPAFNPLATAKRQYDPQTALTPGYELFNA